MTSREDRLVTAWEEHLDPGCPLCGRKTEWVDCIDREEPVGILEGYTVARCPQHGDLVFHVLYFEGGEVQDDDGNVLPSALVAWLVGDWKGLPE